MPHAELSHADEGRSTPPDEVAPRAGDGADWKDDELVQQWASGDRLEELLALPRRITADLLAHAEEPVRAVVDVGSGPGAFLGAILGRLPEAKGIWTDVSEVMRRIAEEKLHRFAGRVEYRVLDLADLPLVASPGSVDAVVTSRLSHHLSSDGLAAFYATASALVRPGGWIANLDHVRVGEPWASRLAEARADLVPPNPSPHRHDRPHPTLGDHLDALGRIGQLDVVVPWRAYSTVLVVARRR